MYNAQTRARSAFQSALERDYLVHVWEHALAQGLDKTSLPPIVPIVVSQRERPWPHGRKLQAALAFPKELAPYKPDFRYALCDLTGLRETEMRGAACGAVANEAHHRSEARRATTRGFRAVASVRRSAHGDRTSGDAATLGGRGGRH